MRLLVMTAALLFLLPASAQAAEGDLIVKRAPGLDGTERAELRADAGVELVETLPLERTELVRAADPARALAELRADDDVVYAEPDRPMHLTRTMNDSAFSWQWALQNTGQWIGQQFGTAGDDIDATTAWDRSDGAGVKVAVADSGIAADHVDLDNQIATNPGEAGGKPDFDDDGNGYPDDLHGWDFVSDDTAARDGNGHGTHVSGTIGGATSGVAKNVRLYAVRVRSTG